MKVLLVEDDLDQLSVRCMLLDQSGFATFGASDGSSALQLATAEKPECAVIDLQLPTPELGLRLISQLKELDPAIHIIVLTGINPDRIAQRPEAKLVDEFIVKGASSVRLIQILRSVAARNG